IRAAERLAAAYSGASDSMKSVEKFRIVYSLGHAAETAVFAILAATDRVNAGDNRKLAAEEAVHAIRPIKLLSNEAAVAASEAALQDYDLLLREYGEHEEVVLGEPVVCLCAE